MTKKIVVIIGVILLVLIGALVLYKHNNPSVPPTQPTQIEGPTQNLHRSSDNEVSITPAGQQAINKDSAVAKLLGKVPVKGTYFQFAFNDQTWKYVLILQSAYQQQGNQEFDLFLRANGIDDRSWITNLQVVAQ